MSRLGHEAPLNDYRSIPESTQLSIDLGLASKTEEPTSIIVPDETSAGKGIEKIVDPNTIVDSPSFPISPHAKPRAIMDIVESRTEFDRQDAQGFKSARLIREDVGGAALTTEDIGRKETRSIVSRSTARTSKRRSPSKGKGWRVNDVGPTEIAEEITRNNGRPSEEDAIIGALEARKILDMLGKKPNERQ